MRGIKQRPCLYREKLCLGLRPGAETKAVVEGRTGVCMVPHT